MLEIPESTVIGGQIAQATAGRTITQVQANASPHGFAWFYGTPDAYPTLLSGCRIGSAASVAGYVRIDAGRATLLFGDGVNLRWIAPEAKRPKKHQLLLELDDGAAIAASVQMYGGLWAFDAQENAMMENPYYAGAVRKPSPLTDAFDRAWYDSLLSGLKPTVSTKAFLATEQRIPGLGNGTLQDILFLSGLHPVRPIGTLTAEDHTRLFDTIRQTLRQMTEQGGRDTEKDFFARPGGYRTLLSRKTYAHPCPKCGGPIERKAYLGGNVYFCPKCQPLVR